VKRKDIEAFALALPGATLDFPFGDSPVFKVGGKMFATAEAVKPNAQSHTWFKCSDLSFAMLIEREGVEPAPYLARAKWVAAEADAMDADELKARLAEAHRIVASKLPKKARDALFGAAIEAKPAAKKKVVAKKATKKKTR